MTIQTFSNNKFKSFESFAFNAKANFACSRFNTSSAILIMDAIIVASIFVVLLSAALVIRVLMLAVLALLVVTVIIIVENLINGHKMLTPKS